MAIFVAFFALLASLLTGPLAPSSGAQSDTEKYLTQCGQVPNSLKVFNPPELRSTDGVLSVTLTVKGDPDPVNSTLCYVWSYPTKSGSVLLAEPPTLHVKQGEKIFIKLVNTLTIPPAAQPHVITNGVTINQDPMPDSMAMGSSSGMGKMDMSNGHLACNQPYTPPTPQPRNKQTGRVYGYHRPAWNETNLHFHGLNISPKSPGDDVVSILLCPELSSLSPSSFLYELDIPDNEPPGTYWYHPHPHGESDHQLLSGLTGVIIIDTATKSLPDTLPNKVIVIRDEGTAGEARPRWGGGPSAQHIAMLEQQFTGQNFYKRPGGYPFQDPDQCPPPVKNPQDAKAVTVNHVPLPADPKAVNNLPITTIASGETDYYRLANTSSDTILDVVATVNGKPANIMVTSRDSVPLVYSKGAPTWQAVPFDHVFVPPASRFEFYLTGTNPGDKIVFTTLTIDSGCWGDVTLQRNLFLVVVTPSKGKQQIARLPQPTRITKQRFADLYNAVPVAHRVFAFTEYNAQGDFYITELSNPKAYEKPYTMGEPPEITVKAGTVEDWTILDYTQETHMFHIHQIHFLVLHAKDYEFGLGQLLDTVNVPYGAFKAPGDTSGNDFIPGSVTLRMDFRDKDIIGEFPFHCHILAHEDGGMMANIRVVP